ncbi:btk-binding protein-related [Anaeramoeba flamelloides]|uniref:Btk-binding protein-related n=1 Tax=Anaeramoeba flamelloides TaxID=1746091 RepID=A0AAV8A4G1_9EUKA|nr:btk-binding protein-related [Anaeramoeba flamelloides]
MSNIKSLGDPYPKTKQSDKFETLSLIKTFPQEVTKVIDVVDTDDNIVFLSSEGKLYQTTGKNYHEKLKAFENLPPIKSIASGYFHFLALSNEEKPKVYGWGKNNEQQLGFDNNGKVFIEKPTLIESLKEENIEQIFCIGFCSFFLNKKTNVLFGCGDSTNGMLGKPEITENKFVKIQKLHENVANVFSGPSDHTLMMKTDGKLYGFGLNEDGELGLGHKKNALKPTQMKLEFPVEDISKIRMAYRLTSILTNDGKLYVTGYHQSTGVGSDLTEFKQYPQFINNNTIIKDIGSGYELFVILTQDNEIWVQGKFNDFNSNNSSVIRKIQTRTNLNNDLSNYNQMKCCDENFIFFLKKNSYLSQDLEKLLKNGYFSDCDIQNIPVHKILIETRIGKTFDLIKKYLESNCKLNEIQDLLKWIYCDQMINFKRTNEILNHFGIQDAHKTKLLKNDLKQLLFDEQTSDFKLVVKNEEEEEEEEEELYIHKFILAARSGLFLNMFQNIEENLHKVKDYSQKSLETIELLISFLYTDELPITADTDQEFIKEEFEDIVDYYQLNPTIPMMDIFEKYIGCGYKLFVILTQDNEIWVQGKFNGSNSDSSSVIRKIQTGTNLNNELSTYNQIKCCGINLIFFFKSNSYLSQDLEKLLKNGYFSDCDIQNIPVHKILIETRIGKTFDLIKKYLESNCKLNEIQDLLKWIYCDEMINSKRTNEILNHFGIQNAQKTKLLTNDLKQLLFDEKTSDFKLVVKNEEEELYIHKFILAARSGLFLNMFQNIEENFQKVKDYSGKSLETIELLISFLYTDELPITADTDQEFIKEEFEDIVEYYQLNPTIPMMNIFEKYSKI